ncbi:cyclin-dependent kinase 11B isoform X2 [Anabrus simplex]|uniref:cyclin-dependent kinase 11B isoform X2 n=1 Tax=Anabrus simplex TaxID=316456 RepID=UPI0035A31813
MSSENEGCDMEVGDQSEDGELTSPRKPSPLPLSKDMEENSFTISEEEADDTADSLDIKPPQAAIIHHHKSSSRNVGSKRDKHLDRESSSRREHVHTSKSESSHRKSHHRSREHRERREERIREKHHHRERRDRKPVERVDRVLEDLRERLLDKRREGERRVKMERRERDRERRVVEEEVITVTAARETPREKAERIEKELRRERLLEADREMLRQKEVYRRELEARRERRHLEKEKERTMRELTRKPDRSESRERKRRRSEDTSIATDDQDKNDSAQVVTVSDDTDEDTHLKESNKPAADLSGNENAGIDHPEEEPSSGPDDDDDEDDDDDDDSDSSSGTDDDEEADTDESGGRNTDADNYNNGTPNSVKMELSDGSITTSPPTDSTRDLQRSFGEEKMEDGNGIPFINDSPKSDVVLKDPLPPYLPAIQGCRSVEEFQCLNRIEEGTYGVVYRARDKRTEEVVALKRLKMEKEKEGFPITSLREINTLLKAQHPNIVTVREIVVGSNMDKIFIVMDYVEHDLKSLMETMKQKKQVFIPGEVKCLMQQLLRAVAHLHDNWILHRDLKTSNLLLSHKGILKVGDFGLAREYGSPLKPYTPIVVTLWYRSPELLLGIKEYSTHVDMWSVGCIFGEFLSMEALFPGKSEVDQLNRIFKDLGTPNEKIWPGYSKLPAVQKMTFAEFPVNQLRSRFGAMITDLGMDLMNRFLTYCPDERITAEDALRHTYFKEAPLPIDPAMFPTWPAKSELGHRKAAASPKPPPGGHEYKQLGDDEEVQAGGFHMGLVEKGRAAVGAGFSLKF